MQNIEPDTPQILHLVIRGSAAASGGEPQPEPPTAPASQTAEPAQEGDAGRGPEEGPAADAEGEAPEAGARAAQAPGPAQADPASAQEIPPAAQARQRSAITHFAALLPAHVSAVASASTSSAYAAALQALTGNRAGPDARPGFPFPPQFMPVVVSVERGERRVGSSLAI